MPDDSYVATLEASGWYFRRADGRKSKRYDDEASAGAAAIASKQLEEANRAARHLARVHLTERHVPLTMLRVAFAKLGSDRLEHFRLSSPQVQQIRNAILVRALSKTNNETDLPITYRRYESLYHDLLGLDWEPALDELAVNCTDLVAALAEVLRRNEDAERHRHGHPTWQWAASVLALADASVGRELDDALVAGTMPVPELARLASARTRCPLSSHVHLIAYLIREYFSPEIASPTRTRRHLIDCIVNQADSVLDAAREEVSACRAAIRSAQMCAGSRDTLSGGITAKAVAQTFFGFSALSFGWDAFVALGAPSVQAGQARARPDRHASGPKMVDYAGDEWSSRSVWDAIPLGAGILSAQGQTRSPKGRRA